MVHFEGRHRFIYAVTRPISLCLTVADLSSDRQIYNDTKSDSTPILSSMFKKCIPTPTVN